MTLEQKMIDRIILAMAWDKTKYQDEIQWGIKPIVVHFTAIKLSRYNGFTKYIDHWKHELTHDFWH